MIRAVLTCAAFAFAALPAPLAAQTALPRAAEIFAGVTGYADLGADRVGTPARPVPGEMGALLLLRMFRNTCLGLESGASLDAAMPEGFAAYAASPYSLGGSEPAVDGRMVLSATGSIDIDETEGHPVIWLRPNGERTICQVEWRLAEGFPSDRHDVMALLLTQWLPWEFALVRATPPALQPGAPVFDVVEWDRPCGGAWCPMTVLYDLPGGSISLETTLSTLVTGPAR